MKFLEICKNKKHIITAVLTLMLVISSTIISNSECKTIENNQKVQQIQMVNQQKSIGIKTNRLNKQINGKPMKVGATAYCNDPITSTGTKPIEGTTIAVDPTIIPYGSKVYIPQFNRVFIAEDCGSAIKGNRIDIYMNDYNRCMEWGFQQITIYILNN